MKKRIFVALPISEGLQNKILEWEKGFQELFMVSPPNPLVRWLAGKNLHITLVPPFYVDDQELHKVKNALQTVRGFGVFEISFSRVAFGPNLRQPRLIWAEGETPKEMPNLQKKIYEIFGKEPEKRPLKLHLTIARFRSENFSSSPIKKLDEKVDWLDKADRVVLFESVLSSAGADYERLQEVLL